MVITTTRAGFVPLTGRIPFGIFLGLFIVVLMVPANAARAQIGVSPPRTEFHLDGPTKTHTLRVFNLGENSVDIEIEVNNWELDEQNKVVIIPPTEQSLDQWLVINPLRFSLEPGASQAVRFAARPRVEPTPGEHRALIYFQQIPDETVSASPAKPRVLFRLGTSVIGLAEPVIRDAVIHSVSADATEIEIEIESRGNTHVRLDGQWALWNPDSFPGQENTSVIEGLGEDEEITLPKGVIAARPLNTLPVLPGTTRIVRTSIGTELEPGTYVLDMNGVVAGVDLGQSLSIVVAAPPEDPETTLTDPEDATDKSDSVDGTEEPSTG